MKMKCKVREILKDPFYQKKFLQMIWDEIKYLPLESQKSVVQEIKKRL